MTRTRRFIGGVGLGSVNQFVLTAAGLWLTPFLLHSLGREQYGLWLVATQILVYLSLVDLGIVAILPREIAAAVGHARGDLWNSEISAIVGRTMRIVAIQTLLALTAAGAVVVFFPAAWDPLRGPLLLVLAVFVATFPFRVLQAVLLGVQDIAYLGSLQLLTWSLGTALTVVLVLRGHGIGSLAAGWVVVQVVSPIGWLIRLATRFPHLIPRRLPALPMRTAGSQIAKGAWVSIGQVAQVLVAGADILLIGKILGPSYVVIYSITDKLVTVLQNQPQMLMQAAVPGLAEMRASARPSDVLRVSSALSQALLLVTGLVVCIVLAINKSFVREWVGAQQYGGFVLTGLLVLEMLLRHINVSAVYTIFAFGRERRIAIVNLLDGLVSVTAAMILLPRIGVNGAAVGLIIGVVGVSLPMNFSALFSITGGGARAFVRPLYGWLIRFVPLSFAAILVQSTWTPQSLVSVALLAISVAVVYGLVMLPCLLSQPLAGYIPQRLGRQISIMLRRGGGPMAKSGEA